MNRNRGDFLFLFQYNNNNDTLYDFYSSFQATGVISLCQRSLYAHRTLVTLFLNILKLRFLNTGKT